MAQVIKLRSTYRGNKPGTILTVDDAVAAQLLQAGIGATTDLTGGVREYNVVVTPSYQPQVDVLAPFQVSAGGRTIVSIPPGYKLSAKGTATTAAGKLELLSATDGTVEQTATLTNGEGALGPFEASRQVRAFVDYGTVTLSAVFAAGGVGAPAREKKWRGIGQGMAVSVQGFSGGLNWSTTNRTRHYSNVKFRRVRAVLQTFYPAGSNPIADANFADDYNFQVGFETNYASATTGLAPRKMFTFGGSQTAQYLAASPPSTGYIISDVLDLGADIPAQQFFGLWTTVEHPAQGANKIPYTRNGSNFLQRYGGIVTSATSNIANDVTRSATSVSPMTSAQSGASTYFTPVMLLIETDSALPFIVHLTDSLGYGVGEGQPGSGSNGDGLGSPLSNNGLVDRAIYETLGYSSVNFGKGGDRIKFLATPANWEKRAQLLKLANPTHVIHGNIHNDLGEIFPINNWVASTAIAKWDTCAANGNSYICVKAGTTGTVSVSGTGGGIIDGTVIWAQLQTHPAGSGPRSSTVTAAQMAAVHEQIQTLLPGIKIIAMLPTPDAASTDAWASVANQTPPVGMGPAGSRRSLNATMMRNKHPVLGITDTFDPSAFLEDSFPTETSKWVSNGAPSYVTNDGTHPNSTGYKLAMPALTHDKFA